MPSTIGESLIILFASYSREIANNPDCALEARGEPAHEVGVKSHFRFLGLRWGRLRQWWQVVTAEGNRPTFKEWAKMARLVARRTVGKWPRPEERRAILHNYRKCVRCPFHSTQFHQCLGCNCVMPLKLAFGGGCWAREQDPNSTFGFAAGEQTDLVPSGDHHG